MIKTLKRAALAGACLCPLLLAQPALAETAAAQTKPQEQRMYTARQQKNLEIIETALDNARAGRLDLAKPYFTDDFVLTVAEGLPTGGVYRGWDGYVECLEKIRNFWVATKHVDREFIPLDDNRVFVHFTLSARIKKNNELVEMPVVAIWTMRGDQISEIINFYFDTKRIVDLAAK